MKIAILGAGAFGTALGGLLADKGWDIDYYDSKIERERLSKVVQGAMYQVLAVPSRAVGHLAPHLPKDVPLIVATKGILTRVALRDFSDVMVMSGPGFAEDIKAHKPTQLTVTDARIKELFKADFMQFDYTADVTGVLMCGALKNVYAIGAGLRKLEKNTRKWREYVEKCAGEMRALISANNGEAATVDLACGVGDLELTCGLPSRNYEYGLQLSADPEAVPEKTVEGVSTLSGLRRGEIEIPGNAEILRELIRLKCGLEDKWS